MPNVKNRIASFEAHNEELRSLHSPLSSAGSPPVVSPASQEPYVESPERPPSTTLQAAQSRRSRLQREQWGQADEAQTTQPSYKGSALMNHHRKKTEKSNGRRSPVNKATELSQRHLTMQPKPRGGEPANAREASPPPPVVKEPVRSGRMNKIQRIKNMRIERQRTPVPKSEPPQVNQSSSADHANDDDITLTSVRQIVGSDKEAASKKEDRPLDRVHRQWIEQGEEKSDKAMGRRGIVMARSSSSDYETDTSRGPAGLAEQVLKGEPSMSASQITPDVSVFFDGRRSRNEPNKDDDTYDYSGRDVEEANQRSNGLRTFESAKSQDDDSQGSVSYSQKRERAKEEQARKKAAAAAKAGMVNPFMQKEDMEHYRKQMDTPTVKTAAGVAAAATVGCIVLGPVGLLVGAAAVGIGMGVMQIPEEQRSNMRDKATEALKNAQEQAINATESLSNSCAAHYQNSGMDEHVPPEMKTCCTAIDNEVSKVTSGALGVDEEDEEGNGEAGNVEGTAPQGPKTKERIRGSSPHRFSKKKDKVACLRQGKIIRSVIAISTRLHRASPYFPWLFRRSNHPCQSDSCARPSGATESLARCLGQCQDVIRREDRGHGGNSHSCQGQTTRSYLFGRRHSRLDHVDHWTIP